MALSVFALHLENRTDLKWSCKFSPTPDSQDESIPSVAKSGRPIPECSRIFGELIAPAASSTSAAALPRAAVLSSVSPRRRLALQDKPRRMRVGDYRRWTPLGRAQETLGCVPTHTAGLVDLEEAGALVVAVIEISARFNTESSAPSCTARRMSQFRRCFYTPQSPAAPCMAVSPPECASDFRNRAAHHPSPSRYSPSAARGHSRLPAPACRSCH